MSREDQYDVTVTVTAPGLTPLALGTFDKMSGGEVSADDTKYRAGGLAAEISLGGPKSVENVTVSRLYSMVDHGRIVTLAGYVGKASVSVSKQPLDTNGARFGSPIVYTGVLIRVGFPDVDSESSDAAMWELELSAADPVVGPAVAA